MREYINNWIEWFILSYQLVSYPFVTLFCKTFDIFAPKWLIYLIFRNTINKSEYQTDYGYDVINKLLDIRKISVSQANKLRLLLDTKPVRERVMITSEVNFSE